MRKLLKLRDWLTLEEAAESLSVLFGEDISPADLVRIALDGRLTLSVRFVNNVHAKGGPAVAIQDARQAEFVWEGATLTYHTGIRIGGAWVIELAPEIKTLTGVWDLPMIAGEKLDVEHYYQTLTYGPAVELTCLEGVFITGLGFYWKLQDHVSNNPLFDQDLVKQPWGDPANFYPASLLPHDVIFVIRPESFRDLIERVKAADGDAPSSLALPTFDAAKPDDSTTVGTTASASRAGGRPLSALWPEWVAELVAHIHEDGIPAGVGSAGQDALIACVEERLGTRDLDAPGRTTVQDTVRAVLRRLRDAGN